MIAEMMVAKRYADTARKYNTMQMEKGATPKVIAEMLSAMTEGLKYVNFGKLIPGDQQLTYLKEKSMRSASR